MPLPTIEQQIRAGLDLMRVWSTADNPAGLHESLAVVEDFLGASALRGMCVERFESGGKPSILAYFTKQPGDKRPKKFLTVLSGHADVVGSMDNDPKLFEPYIQDGVIYGRGAVDMELANIALAAAFAEFGPPFAALPELDDDDETGFGIAYQIGTDEEKGGMHGVLHQIEQGVRAGFVIFGECGRHPGKHPTIAYETKGMAMLDLEWRKRSPGDDFISRAAAFIVATGAYYPYARQPLDTIYAGPTFTETTAVFGLLHSQAANPSISREHDMVTATLDVRYKRGDENFASEAAMAAFIAEVDKKAGSDVRLTGIPIYGLPMYTPPNHPAFVRLMDSMERVEGIRPHAVIREGTGDGRHYSLHGDAACECGIEGKGEHTDGTESVTIAAYEKYVAVIRNFLAETLKAERTRRLARV